MPDLDADRFDIAMGGISVNLERQKHGLFSTPYLRDGKTPITRCENTARYQTLAQIDQPGVRVVTNPGGTNERFDRAHLQRAQIVVHADNTTIFDALLAGEADVMLTDATETRLQQHLRPALCAIHPDQPFDFSEKAFLLPNDFRWKAWVDQWQHQAQETGQLPAMQAHWLAWKWLQTPPQNDGDRLAALVAERLKLAVDVAEYKWNTGQAIEDKPREQIILDGLVDKAAHAGIPAERAKTFFRAQIEASKIVQRQLFAEWEKQKAGHFADAPDLAGETRPKLDALTDKLIEALARSEKTLADAAERPRVDAAIQRYLSDADWGDATAVVRTSLAAKP